jgi:hypothetical protein
VTADRCCDLHGTVCEPPSELCCGACTEAAHPEHADGSLCAAPGDIQVTRFAPRAVVEHAPAQSLVSLGLIAGADQQMLFISGDRLYLGNDRHGREVVYRITGWSTERVALLVERVEP